ncbi:MAG TPA: elongation factor 1-beta [Archaeoglobus sp.]|nr:elongation factor 1-beta [Archaeoglobus sp.]
MGKVLMKIRVMPTDVNTNLNDIQNEIKKIKLESLEIRDFSIKPIAFGLKSLIVLAVLPDKEGIGDKLIEEISKIENVESVEVDEIELL